MSTVSEALESSVVEFLNYTSTFSGHVANKINPHSVTKEQVGLSNLTNEKQATITDLGEHIEGIGNRHKADCIMYNDNYNLKEFLSALILESGSGTMNHNFLQNRECKNAHSAGAITNLGEIYCFKTVTTSNVPTEIFTQDSGEHINDLGRIKIGVGTTIGFEINMVCGIKGTDRSILAKTVRQSGMITRTANTTVLVKTSEAVAVSDNGLSETFYTITPNNAETAASDGSVSIKVNGLTSNSLCWKLVVKIMSISLSEFN